MVTARKEILVALRHILATEFRVGFVAQVEPMLEEGVVIGRGREEMNSLRPLALQTMADFVHFACGKLTVLQLARALRLFARHIHDPQLELPNQMISVRILLTLVEHIHRKRTSVRSELFVFLIAERSQHRSLSKIL